MRADRLIIELMLLQVRGKMTARALANELAVTERTIYRDIEALSISGVPVYAERGPGGGISLVESYRTTLTGLKRGEVRALFMLSIPAALAEIGLDEEAQTAFMKLSAALPGTLRDEEQRTRQRFYIDQSGWQTIHGPKTQSALIQQAVWEDRMLTVRYQSILGERIAPHEGTIEPYGLVAWRGEWYLVFRQASVIRVLRLDRILNAEISPEHFLRIPNFDLVSFWKKWVVEKHIPSHPFPVHVLAELEALPYLAEYRDVLESTQNLMSEKRDPFHLVLYFKNLEQARDRLLTLGGAVEVLEPKSLRLSIEDYANQVVALYKRGN
jgi:predicted DNA-binding transcriptional regulator YafY